MLTFPHFDPDAERVLTFDCTNDLDRNEVLFGGAQLRSLICSAGIDQNPMSHVIAPPTYDSSGTKILLAVGGFSAFNGQDYIIEVSSATTGVDKIIVVRARLPIRSGTPNANS